MSYSKKIRSGNGYSVYADGVGTKYPIYIVCKNTGHHGENRGPVCHQLSGKHAKENALKRYRWLAWGIPYRSWQNQSDRFFGHLKGVIHNTSL